MTEKRLMLLPQPASLVRTGRSFRMPARIMLDCQIDTLPGMEHSIQAIETQLQSMGVAMLRNSAVEKDVWKLALTVSPDLGGEDYHLVFSPDAGSLVGGSPAGLTYGLHTFRQILVQCGNALPACRIEDKPAFPTRGLYLDVTRGKVPTIATLKRLIDRLTALKMNHLQLYIEHVFDFSFDPDIGRHCAPLTPDDIHTLDEYCRERFIDFVPSLACFGHMGRILSLPAYRDLAEVEWDGPCWAEAPWRQRLRGATIDPRNPQAKALLTRMIDDFLPHFSSRLFNVCADETYDLGRGKNESYAKRHGVAKLYLEHIRFLRRAAANHDKRLMFWGDIMLKHLEAITDIPKDCTVLDWGYARNTDFDKCRHFVRSGLHTFVCPSTRGYQVVFNQVEEARANIRGYARAGHEHGAEGLLVTDWGDMGHFNMRTCSLHGIALGAHMGWNPDAATDRRFDRAFAKHLLGSESPGSISFFKRAGSTKTASWPFMLAPFADIPHSLPSRPQVRSALNSMEQAASFLQDETGPTLLSSTEIDELRLGCRAIALNARKALLCRELRKRSVSRDRLQKDLKKFSDDLERFTEAYEDVWVTANRRSGVQEIRRALKSVATSARKASRQAV